MFFRGQADYRIRLNLCCCNLFGSIAGRRQINEMRTDATPMIVFIFIKHILKKLLKKMNIISRRDRSDNTVVEKCY